ncbi:MAG: bifunctional sugar-1-phosphate nucleotidylyltransferase/acetyltransferase [Methermicoccaceae archaeon]
MKAVVLAAGEGDRCRPLTLTRPKVMIPVANRPILEHVVDALKECDITDIVMVVGYRKESIMDHFGDGVDFGVDISYVYQPHAIGTAHALEVAEEEVSGEDRFLVLNGDNVVDSTSIKSLMSSTPQSVLATLSDTPSRYGVITDHHGRLERIVEKPYDATSHLINTGMYLFDSRIFEYIDAVIQGGTEGADFSLTHAIQLMVDDKIMVDVIRTGGLWVDVVYPWDTLTTNEALLRRESHQSIRGEVEDGVHIKGQVRIGEGSVVHSGTYIVGPVEIGEDCEIGANCVIMPSTTIGPGSIVGSGTRIESSVLFEGVMVGASSSISNSVIASGFVGGAQLCAEAKPEVNVEFEQEVVKCHRQLGFIAADHTVLGCRVLVKAGCVIGGSCDVSSGACISGYIAPGVKVV